MLIPLEYRSLMYILTIAIVPDEFTICFLFEPVAKHFTSITAITFGMFQY